ncbi:6421_t:CDS:1, partial [Funneliformis mosseae]
MESFTELKIFRKGMLYGRIPGLKIKKAKPITYDDYVTLESNVKTYRMNELMQLGRNLKYNKPIGQFLVDKFQFFTV